ncbi:hypothetical protein F5X96DRAFT_633315 [Biscogniauxia mediterranea]|nr:hypothetical protein F5X96DRAFT_633315 [Biscogniauxia mediterranea]
MLRDTLTSLALIVKSGSSDATMRSEHLPVCWVMGTGLSQTRWLNYGVHQVRFDVWDAIGMDLRSYVLCISWGIIPILNRVLRKQPFAEHCHGAKRKKKGTTFGTAGMQCLVTLNQRSPGNCFLFHHPCMGGRKLVITQRPTLAMAMAMAIGDNVYAHS